MVGLGFKIFMLELERMCHSYLSYGFPPPFGVSMKSFCAVSESPDEDGGEDYGGFHFLSLVSQLLKLKWVNTHAQPHVIL